MAGGRHDAQELRVLRGSTGAKLRDHGTQEVDVRAQPVEGHHAAEEDVRRVLADEPDDGAVRARHDEVAEHELDVRVAHAARAVEGEHAAPEVEAGLGRLGVAARGVAQCVPCPDDGGAEQVVEHRRVEQAVPRDAIDARACVRHAGLARVRPARELLHAGERLEHLRRDGVVHVVEEERRAFAREVEARERSLVRHERAQLARLAEVSQEVDAAGEKVARGVLAGAAQGERERPAGVGEVAVERVPHGVDHVDLAKRRRALQQVDGLRRGDGLCERRERADGGKRFSHARRLCANGRTCGLEQRLDVCVLPRVCRVSVCVTHGCRPPDSTCTAFESST